MDFRPVEVQQFDQWGSGWLVIQFPQQSRRLFHLSPAFRSQDLHRLVANDLIELGKLCELTHRFANISTHLGVDIIQQLSQCYENIDGRAFDE